MKLVSMCGATLLAGLATAVHADYPEMKVIHRPDGQFYTVPLALGDGSYEELEVEVSPRRFLFCSQQQAPSSPQAATLFDCAIERDGRVAMGRLGLLPVRTPDGAPVSTEPAHTTPVEVDRSANGKSYYRVPVSTLTRSLESLEREVSDEHFLFCSKVRRENPALGKAHFEIQCLVEHDGHVRRTREDYAPTAPELAALHEVESAPAGEALPEVKGPFHAL